jgi:hypothetical protein
VGIETKPIFRWVELQIERGVLHLAGSLCLRDWYLALLVADPLVSIGPT